MRFVMRAVVRHQYGGPEVLKVEKIQRPKPGPGQALVRVRASSLNRADLYTLRGQPTALRLWTGPLRPCQRGLGQDLAGDIEELGPGVQGLERGQAVYGLAHLGRTWAEYACVPAQALAPKPRALSYEEAATLPLAATTALQGLRDHARLAPGQSVLINGASGSVGPFAVQLARALGAGRVVAVCRAAHRNHARWAGADDIIAYDEQDFTRLGERFDVLLDLVGERSPWACRAVLKPSGVYVGVGAPAGAWAPLWTPLRAALQAPFLSQRVTSFTARPSGEELRALSALVGSGQLHPLISRRFLMEEVGQALRYLQRARPAAKITLRM